MLGHRMLYGWPCSTAHSRSIPVALPGSFSGQERFGELVVHLDGDGNAVLVESMLCSCVVDVDDPEISVWSVCSCISRKMHGQAIVYVLLVFGSKSSQKKVFGSKG